MKVPQFSLGVDAPLFVPGSREGGRLFKYQLELPFWICFDGHEAPDVVRMALGGKSGNRGVPKKMKWKQTIGTHGKVVKLLVTRGEEYMTAILRVPQERPIVYPNTLGFGIPQLAP